MSVPSYEREVYQRLFSHDGWLDLFELHTRWSLSPGQLSSAIEKLLEERMVEVKGTNAKLTERGRVWIVKNRREIFMDVERKWDVPKAVSEHRIAAGEPYLPRIRSLSMDFFEKLD